MPKIIIQTDEGTTINTYEFPMASMYGLMRMPGCPSHIGVHNLLNWLKGALRDAERVQNLGEGR